MCDRIGNRHRIRFLTPGEGKNAMKPTDIGQRSTSVESLAS
jgi:hypothetical protein